ncbi:MAG TPA: type II toxin-antitoxin system HipA family toxin YjjJ [Steroidobacteraceae bacterium]|jgi:hypothetical protein
MPLTTAESILRRLDAGTASSPELEKVLGQSQSAVSRQLRQLLASRQVIRIGSTRGARYGRVRQIEGIGSQWPLRRIDQSGRIHSLGTLTALAGDQYYFQAEAANFAWSGLAAGLPYFLQDQRPAGFLGRAVPRRYPELNLPQRVDHWNDDHYLQYLTLQEADPVGDLVLGDGAFDVFLARQRRRESIPVGEREQRYPQLVTDVMEGGLPGSSAQGEQPKFTALIEDHSGPRHVIVKFSPLVNSAVGQRWSDLLIAEHLAHEVLSQSGIAASRSRIEHYEGRTYLEVDRFDRAGLEGRIGVTSLFAIDTVQYGRLDNWIAAALRLRNDQRIDDDTLELVRLVATFGSLIANTDRHFGNLAFYDQYDGRYTLAPIYDMLPMFFKPEHDQVTARVFAPPDPTSETLNSYGRARALAEGYWARIVAESRVSDEFRDIAAAAGAALKALPRTGGYVYAEDSASLSP